MDPASKRADYTTWKPLLVCPDAALAGQLRAACGELGTHTPALLAQYPRIGGLAAALTEHRANVCLIDVGAHAEFALLLIGEAAAAVPVVALNTRNDAELILRCLRRGACEFLSDPGSLAAVFDRLRLLSAPAETSKPCAVYCVIPGKPGCGASTLAMHLAVECKRSGVPRVLLVDADLESGALAFLLKLKPDFHLGDAVRDRQRMDDDLWGRLAVPSNGVDVLLAPESPAARVSIDSAAAQDLFAFWRSRYDAVVIDTAGVHPHAVEFARLADRVLLVTTNELVAMHASRRAVERLEHHSLDRTRLSLVINRYTPSMGLKRDEVETALKLAPYALLPNEYDVVQQAVLEGRPVAAGTRLARAVHAIAERLTGAEQPAAKKPSLFGLLQRRN